MKNETEVRTKLMDLVYEAISKSVDLTTEKVPHKCTYNHRHSLDARKWVNGDVNESYNRVSSGKGLPVIQSVGLCMLGAESPEEWSGTICDEPIDAKRCPYFTPNQTKEEVVTEVQEKLKDLSWIREHIPEAYGLLWVLGDVKAPELSWWQRVRLWFIKPKPEPVLPPFDPKKLLPSGD